MFQQLVVSEHLIVNYLFLILSVNVQYTFLFKLKHKPQIILLSWKSVLANLQENLGTAEPKVPAATTKFCMNI